MTKYGHSLWRSEYLLQARDLDLHQIRHALATIAKNLVASDQQRLPESSGSPQVCLRRTHETEIKGSGVGDSPGICRRILARRLEEGEREMRCLGAHRRMLAVVDNAAVTLTLATARAPRGAVFLFGLTLFCPLMILNVHERKATNVLVAGAPTFGMHAARGGIPPRASFKKGG